MEINKIQLFLLKIRRRIQGYFFSLLFKLKCAFLAGEIVTFTLADGSHFDYPLRSYIGYALFAKDFEETEIAFLRRSLKPGDIFLDVGANGGIYSVIAAKQVGPQGHVYAFEPGERELALLRHNIELNNLTNVTVMECAVSNKSGIAKFAVVKDGALNSLAALNRTEQQIEYWKTVTTTSLDDFLSKYAISKVDFIKIDVEGAEKLVLDGAKKLLGSNHRVTILFEASDYNEPAFGYSAKQLLNELCEAGLNIYCLDGLSRLQNIDMADIKLGKKIYNFVTYSHS
jgi:FkbM family methyltransferase